MVQIILIDRRLYTSITLRLHFDRRQFKYERFSCWWLVNNDGFNCGGDFFLKTFWGYLIPFPPKKKEKKKRKIKKTPYSRLKFVDNSIRFRPPSCSGLQFAPLLSSLKISRGISNCSSISKTGYRFSKLKIFVFIKNDIVVSYYKFS